MDRVCLIGASWRTVGVDGLIPFTIARDERADRLTGLSNAVRAEELVYLATCNRVEVTLVGDASVSPDEYRNRVFEALTDRPARNGEAARRLKAWIGEGAAEHLFLVTAGMDSARVGEREIMGQVRDAVDQSSGLGLLGDRLDVMFMSALRLARRIHTETELGAGKTSLATVAADEVRRFDPDNGPVALVGLSPMTVTCGRDLARDGRPIVVVNRTPEHAAEFAREIGADCLGLAAFRAAPPAVRSMVVATGSAAAIFDHRDLARVADASTEGGAFLVIDMAIPPNVPPADAQRAGWTRIGLADIVEHAGEHVDSRMASIADARMLIDDGLDMLRTELAVRTIGPALAALREDFRELAREYAERVLMRQLGHLPEADRQHVMQLADGIARRLAHVPLRGLRNVAADAGIDTVRRFLAASDRTLDEAVHAVDEVVNAPDMWTELD